MKSYYISIEFYSEDNFKGNMSLFYYIGRTAHKIKYGGRALKKVFVEKAAALKAAERTFGMLTNARAQKDVRVRVYEQKLHEVMPKEIQVFE